jgi:hypothetical protein
MKGSNFEVVPEKFLAPPIKIFETQIRFEVKQSEKRNETKLSWLRKLRRRNAIWTTFWFQTYFNQMNPKKTSWYGLFTKIEINRLWWYDLAFCWVFSKRFRVIVKCGYKGECWKLPHWGSLDIDIDIVELIQHCRAITACCKVCCNRSTML